MEVSTSQEQPQDRRVSKEPLDASDVPSTRADMLTNAVSEPPGPPSLTRPELSHCPALQSSTKMRCSSVCGQPRPRASAIRRRASFGVDAVADEPAPDDDAGPAAAGPAVHVHDAAGVELGVDLVERRDEAVARRDREVADRPVDVARGWLDERRVRLELAALRQVEEERDARVDEVAAPRARRSPAPRRTGWRPAMSASGLDDGRRAHDGEVCTRAATPSGGSVSYGVGVRADSRGMARLDTSATELRDRALVARGRARRRPRRVVRPRARGGSHARASSPTSERSSACTGSSSGSPDAPICATRGARSPTSSGPASRRSAPRAQDASAPIACRRP